MKRPFHRETILTVLTLLLLLVPTTSFSGKPDSKGVSPQTAADYIHSVIEANRTIYSEVIVERLAITINLQASENWKEENTLPLPAQFLLASSQASNKKGIGMSYRLMSLWPINPENGPQSDFEREGMKEVLKNPKEPSSRIVDIHGKQFFQSIYPDKAVTKACVTCHNNHPKTPKTNFKLGDVMGAILINIPLENKSKGASNEKRRISPEVVADYIHTVLESDRKVYSELIVNRLQNKKIVYASETWWEDNSLLLPAQFLLNASDLILNKKLELHFKLMSLWPINPRNQPANEFEHQGLEYVAQHPIRPFIGSRDVGGRKYFQAVYPDFAVTPACVSCHNNHPKSPKRDFKLNDVMGGIFMAFPLNDDKKSN